VGKKRKIEAELGEEGKRNSLSIARCIGTGTSGFDGARRAKGADIRRHSTRGRLKTGAGQTMGVRKRRGEGSGE